MQSSNIQYFIQVPDQEPITLVDISSFTQLSTEIQRSFPSLSSSSFNLSYYDDEGDCIRLTTNLEFSEAQSFARSNEGLLVICVNQDSNSDSDSEINSLSSEQPVSFVESIEKNQDTTPAVSLTVDTESTLPDCIDFNKWKEQTSSKSSHEQNNSSNKPKPLAPLMDMACSFLGLNSQAKQSLEQLCDQIPVDTIVREISNPENQAQVAQGISSLVDNEELRGYFGQFKSEFETQFNSSYNTNSDSSQAKNINQTIPASTVKPESSAQPQPQPFNFSKLFTEIGGVVSQFAEGFTEETKKKQTSSNTTVQEVAQDRNSNIVSPISTVPLNSANDILHEAICDHCEQQIRGVRYKCVNCEDYDLCAACESKTLSEEIHNPDHLFAKLNKPKQQIQSSKPQSPSLSNLNRIDELTNELTKLKEQLAVKKPATENLISQQPAAVPSSPSPSQSESDSESKDSQDLEIFHQMGFSDRIDEILLLLKQHNNDVESVLNILLG